MYKLKHFVLRLISINLVLSIVFLIFIGCSEKSGKVPEKISQLQNFELPHETNDLDISVEEIKKDDGIIIINGWSAIKGQDSQNALIYCVLKSNKSTYIFDTFQLYKRPDVTAHFKINRDNSGFNAIIPTNKIDSGTYQIGILIKKNNTSHFQFYAYKSLSL